MKHRWTEYDENCRHRHTEDDRSQIARLQNELDQLPTRRRLIPLFGRAAMLRAGINHLEERIVARQEYGELSSAGDDYPTT